MLISQNNYKAILDVIHLNIIKNSNSLDNILGSQLFTNFVLR